MRKRIWARGGGAEQDPVRDSLGSLERAVMEIAWAGGQFTVRDVKDRLDRAIAYTTVMTTLDRLYKKGFVHRTRVGRAFVYTAAQTREQFEASVAGGLRSGLLSRRSAAALPILSNLVDTVGSEDGGLELLDTLEALVSDTRRRMRNGGTR